MTRRNPYRITCLLLALVLLLAATGCSAPAEPGGQNEPLAGAFDPENPREYGMRGAYLGQGIAEAMELLQPVRYEFMDAATRASMTVEQLANGEGSVATGILLLESAQLILRVQDGVVTSIMMAGAPEPEGHKYRTNRGLALYDPVSRVKELYGEAPGTNELVYERNGYRATFSVHDGKVIGFRFDLTR